MPETREFEADAVRKAILHQLGLRIGPEMAAYVARRLAAVQTAPGGAPIPVMAASARTGVPVRQLVDLSGLRAALTA